MRMYNVIQAADYIGCDPKTVRRWLKRGKLTAERTERGWLAIPGGQVEYAKIQWEKEQEQFARPGQSKESIGIQHKDTIDNLRRLEDRIAKLEAIISAQNEKIASLEKAMSNVSLDSPSHPKTASTSKATSTISAPQNRIVDAKSPSLPPGTLYWKDFAEQIGIKDTVLEGIIRRGIDGEHLERIEIPTAKPGNTTKYFSIEQQEKAIEFLRKFGKLKDE